MLRAGPQCADLATFRDAGLVAAWRAGLPQYRDRALAIARRLDPTLAERRWAGGGAARRRDGAARRGRGRPLAFAGGGARGTVGDPRLSLVAAPARSGDLAACSGATARRGAPGRLVRPGGRRVLAPVRRLLRGSVSPAGSACRGCATAPGREESTSTSPVRFVTAPSRPRSRSCRADVLRVGRRHAGRDDRDLARGVPGGEKMRAATSRPARAMGPRLAGALALWSRYTQLHDPTWCLTREEEAAAGSKTPLR